MFISRALAHGRAATAVARRGIAVGDSLLGTQVALQRARSWDEADADGFAGVTLDALFKGRKVALFALPGAFTGVCEKGHVPSFAALAAEFTAKGVDEIACVSVNDPYTMRAWANVLDADGVAFYGDSDASFTELAGQALDLNDDALGPGKRSNRYAVLVDDGVVTRCFVEAGAGDLEVSDGRTLLESL